MTTKKMGCGVTTKRSGRRGLGECLPCGVLRSVECGSCALGVDVEDVLAAEGVRVGVVLVGAEAPFGGAGPGVDGDAAEECDLLVLNVNSVDQGFVDCGVAG